MGMPATAREAYQAKVGQGETLAQSIAMLGFRAVALVWLVIYSRSLLESLDAVFLPDGLNPPAIPL